MTEADRNKDDARAQPAPTPVTAGDAAGSAAYAGVLVEAFGVLPQPLRATILMLLAMACFATMAVFIRLAAQGVHALEVVFFATSSR